MDDYLLLGLDGDERVLVLGMRWHTILGSRLEQRARQKARQMKASHYAHAAHSEAVGLVRLARADRGLAAACHSGALAFAAGHAQGIAALRACLPDGRVWVVAAQAGKVLTHSDRIYGSEQEARQALDDLAARHGDVQVYEAGDPESDGTGLAAILMDGLPPHSRLQPSGRGLPSIPRPLAVAVLGCAAALLARGGWDWYQGHRSRSEAPPPSIDPEAAWRQVVHAFASQARVHRQEDWEALLRSLADLPVSLGGWRLGSAQCLREPGAAWSCMARYGRAGRLATNESFRAARPEGWRESWLPMDAVVARFPAGGGGSALDISGLKTMAAHDGQTLSELQRMLPLLSGAAVGEPVRVRFDAPRDVDGNALAPPASLPRLLKRSLKLEGPLRSFFLLPEALAGQVEWRSLVLSIDESAESSLNRSRLMAGISGVLYALD